MRRQRLWGCVVFGLLLGAGEGTCGAASEPIPVATDGSPAAAQTKTFPRVILWAWEHPENLSFIDPQRVGVAYLAATVDLRGERVEIRPRLQPLQVPPGTFLLATVRIEAPDTRSENTPPRVINSDCLIAAADIAELGSAPEVHGVQIDFDARSSEREFYRYLLNEVRRRLPPSKTLSITALASWCAGDNWLAGLPVDEAVPMLFRMGPDRREILNYLDAGGDFSSAICRESVGISTDEQIPRLPADRRVYIFNPGAWTKEAVDKALREAGGER